MLKHPPSSELQTGRNDVEEKMMSVFAQMESIESTESTMPEMANLFELLPKVIMTYQTKKTLWLYIF